MCQSMEQCCRVLSIAEHTGPFREAQLGGDVQAGFLIQLADQMKEQCTAGVAELPVYVPILFIIYQTGNFFLYLVVGTI